jgi:hypothetical protein
LAYDKILIQRELFFLMFDYNSKYGHDFEDFDEEVHDWIISNKIFGQDEKLISYDYTNVEKIYEYKIGQKKARKNVLILNFIGIIALVGSILIDSYNVMLVASAVVFLICCVILLIIHFATIQKLKVLIFTSYRIIIIKTLKTELPDLGRENEKYSKIIYSIPWSSVFKVKFFQKSILFSFSKRRINKVKIYSDEYGNHEIYGIQQVYPLHLYKYIAGNNILYNNIQKNPLSKKDIRKLSKEKLEIVDAILNRKYILSTYLFEYTNQSQNEKDFLEFSFQSPFEVNLKIFKDGENVNKEFDLYDPQNNIGKFSQTKVFSIEEYKKQVYRISGSEGRFLNILLAYFYAMNKPPELEVKYSYKTNIALSKEHTSKTIFTKYEPSLLKPKNEKKLYQSAGIPSKFLSQNRKFFQNQFQLIDFFPSPTDTKEKAQKMIIGTHWIIINHLFLGMKI